MNSRALTVLSISGMALAACSGGQSNIVDPAPEVVSESTDDLSQAFLEVNGAETGAWAASRPPSGPATTFVASPAAGTTTIEPTATFERFKDAEANDAVGTAPLTSGDRLQIRKEAVRYASGKTMFGPDGTGTIEELPLRAYTIRVNQPGGFVFEQGNDGTPSVLGNTDGKYFHSIEVTRNGLVLKIGGNAGQYDQQRRFDMGDDTDDWYGRGPDGIRGTADDGTAGSGKWDGCYTDLPGATADCTNWNNDDTRVTFGRPIAATHGHHAWYWNTRIPLPPGQSATDRNLAAKFDFVYSVNRDLGSYELWISNLARINKNLEDAQKPPHTIDDDAKYLDYAAYGLFLPTDGLSAWQQPGRLISFHFGYDAFADSDDARTSDISNAVTATFRGTTTAQMIHNLTGTSAVRATRTYLRGDVLLNASIGGTGGGKISGEITGFEMLGPDGTWHPHSAIINPKNNERLVLTGINYKTRRDSDTNRYSAVNYSADAATINADGSYEGGVYLQSWDDGTSSWMTKEGPFTDYEGSSVSKFGGTFYGPTANDLENIETAGYWFLTAGPCDDSRRRCTSDLQRYGPIYGSFGAERMSDAN